MLMGRSSGYGVTGRWQRGACSYLNGTSGEVDTKLSLQACVACISSQISLRDLGVCPLINHPSLRATPISAWAESLQADRRWS